MTDKDEAIQLYLTFARMGAIVSPKTERGMARRAMHEYKPDYSSQPFKCKRCGTERSHPMHMHYDDA